MKPYYEDDFVQLYHGDCLEVLATLPDASVDSVVTDPPYGLEFMGKDWDAPWKPSSVGRGARVQAERADEMTTAGKGHTTSAGPYLAARVDSTRVAGKPFQEWCTAWATECLRVLKPGGHMLAFGGTRTWHRLACAVEDAGFEIRDSIAWLYGSGFPKSLDVSKAIDKAAGAQRPTYARAAFGGTFSDDGGTTYGTAIDGEPITAAARAWQGWGSAMKPAFEPVVVARKPLIGTIAQNVLAHGTGALNIGACRVGADVRVNPPSGAPGANAYRLSGGDGRDAENARRYAEASKALPPTTVAGRWPANVLLDDSQAAALDEQSGTLVSGVLAAHHQRAPKDAGILGAYGSAEGERGYGDTGGASRFFPTFRYEAKAPASERPRYTRPMLRLRDDLTPAQVDHVRARLAEAGVQVD